MATYQHKDGLARRFAQAFMESLAAGIEFAGFMLALALLAAAMLLPLFLLLLAIAVSPWWLLGLAPWLLGAGYAHRWALSTL